MFKTSSSSRKSEEDFYPLCSFTKCFSVCFSPNCVFFIFLVCPFVFLTQISQNCILLFFEMFARASSTSHQYVDITKAKTHWFYQSDWYLPPFRVFLIFFSDMFPCTCFLQLHFAVLRMFLRSFFSKLCFLFFSLSIRFLNLDFTKLHFAFFRNVCPCQLAFVYITTLTILQQNPLVFAI